MKPGNSTVFVVDDEKSVRNSLVRLLRSAGCQVEAFASADAFLERLPIDDVGCMVLDISMPGKSGSVLHEQLSDHNCSLPVIFLTGHGDVPMSVREMKKGAVDFLLKPVDAKALLAAVAAALGRHRAALAKQHQQQEVVLHLQQLTQRERQVLECMLDGYMNKQTALQMGIAEKTVKVHRSRVMEKMAVHSVAELVHRCEIAGIHRHATPAEMRKPPA
ncbi:MAG: response regulator [Gammaproteobacteria bacterium]